MRVYELLENDDFTIDPENNTVKKLTKLRDTAENDEHMYYREILQLHQKKLIQKSSLLNHPMAGPRLVMGPANRGGQQYKVVERNPETGQPTDHVFVEKVRRLFDRYNKARDAILYYGQKINAAANKPEFW